MDEKQEERAAHHVQSLARGLAVLTAFGHDTPELTLAEVARRTDLTRAAARRFLLTLTDLGYVHTDGKHFRLTPRVLELGYAYLSSQTLPEVAQPHLSRLSATVGESSSVSVLDGDDVVYVARAAVTRIMTVGISVGTRFPATRTSMGQVLLAAEGDPRFATTRTRGWALVDGELEDGLRSIAAPIRDHTGKVVAAVNIATHASRATPESMEADLLPRLLETCAAIERDLATRR
ncbi:IclR family pca regulon transcriptional regulator [Crossiella equi]|uniref:IclR family pca regulon transcriptional regulator n=1 Tax=Crossiella equi TaxID=130796 RepID=A0ABS5AR25_9PSEU|nr:IclR family transcriptional regulator C-terminal domain-containing protein [Crossiella equi]MBP2479018.1 IclR family pca regulon transcriptional regulator [Crossiella equi]